MARDDWDEWDDGDEEARPAAPPPRRASMFSEPIDVEAEAEAKLAPAGDGESEPEPENEPRADQEPDPEPDPHAAPERRSSSRPESAAERSAQLFDDALPVGYSPYEEGLGDGPQRLDYDFVDKPDDEPLPVAWTGVMRPIKDEPQTGRPRWAGRRRGEDAPTENLPPAQPPRRESTRTTGEAAAADAAPAESGSPAPTPADAPRGWTGPERESTTTVPRSQPAQGSLQRGWLYLPIAVAVGILIGVGGFLGVDKFWGGSAAAPSPSASPTASASPAPSIVAEPVDTPDWPEVNPTPLAGVDLGPRTEPQSVEEPGSYADTDAIWDLAGPGWGLYVWRSTDGTQQHMYLVSPESERFLLARLRTDIDIAVQHWDPATGQSWLQRRFADGSTQTIRFDLRRGRSTEDWVDGFDTVDASYLTTLRDGRDLWVTLSSVTDATSVVAYDPVTDTAAVLPGLEQALLPTDIADGSGYQVVVAALPDPARRSLVVSQELTTWGADRANETTTISWWQYDLAADTRTALSPPELANCTFEYAMIDGAYLMACPGELVLLDEAGVTVRQASDVEAPNPVEWKEVYVDTPDSSGAWGQGVTYSRR